MNGEINIALTNQKSKAHQKNQFIPYISHNYQNCYEA